MKVGVLLILVNTPFLSIPIPHQTYYDFYEHKTLRMNRVNEWYEHQNLKQHEVLSWIEDVLRWTLEEIPLPFKHENIESKAMITEDFAENRDMAIGEAIYTQIIDASFRSRGTYPHINVEIYVHHYYCQSILRILEEFAIALQSEPVRPTLYFQNYEQALNLFKQLEFLLKNELGKISQFTRSAQSDIDALSGQLGLLWTTHLYLAIKASTNLS